jgi:hypothetical protein
MKNLKSYNNFIKESEVNNYVDELNEALNSAYYKYSGSPIKGDTGEIQQFLIDMGTKVVDGKGGSTALKKDWSFGKSTASAVWTYLYGTGSMIKAPLKYPQQKTVGELQTKLGVKSDGAAGTETLNSIAKKFNAAVKTKISNEKVEGTWNKNGESKRYGTVIKNIMNGNTSPYEGTFQSRQTFYRQIHELLFSTPNAEAKAAIKSFGLKPINSNWFQAASAVNQANALGAADNVNLWIISDDTEKMLKECGVKLLKKNIVTAKEMLLGTLDKSFTNGEGKTVKLDKSVKGQKLDNRLVEYEQTELNKIMANYKKTVKSDEWKSMIDGINASFGLPAAPSMISNVIKTYFGPKLKGAVGIVDAFLSSSSLSYAPAKKAITVIAGFLNHTFNIDSYANRAILGKGCVAQLYHGDGKSNGINLI